MSQNSKNRVINNKNLVLVIAILTLIVLNIIQLFINRQSENETKEKYESKQLELVNTYSKLDTISSQLDDRIDHIRRLGGSVDSLIEVKSQLEQDKYYLKQSIKLANSRYEQIKGKVKGYEQIIEQKDKEISSMEQLNERLASEKSELLEKQDELHSTVNRLELEKDILLEQISKVALLSVDNIRFYAFEKNGKPVAQEKFRQGKLEKLQIRVEISENEFAKKGRKKVFMRIIDPAGSSLYNSGSGSFEYNGSNLFYTSKQEFVFNNRNEQIDFSYSKGSEFSKGKYRVELYSEGFKIGEDDFWVE